MINFQKIIDNIGVDKLLHFLVGYSLVVTGLMYSFVAGLWCFIAVVILSIIKETLLDETIDWKDIFASILGGMIGIFMYVPIDISL